MQVFLFFFDCSISEYFNNKVFIAMKEDSPQGIHVELCDDDISHWICYIEGPKDTF